MSNTPGTQSGFWPAYDAGAGHCALRSTCVNRIKDMSNISKVIPGDKPSKNPRVSRVYGGISGDVRRSERRERFIQAGIVAFGRDGYANTTTRSLCADAGLTQRYFYESFESIEALFIEVVKQLGIELETALFTALADAPEEPAKRIQAALRAYFNSIRHDPHIGRILLVEVYAASGRTNPMARDFVAKLTELTRAGIDEAFPTLAEHGINVHLLAAAYVGATHHIALNWVMGGYAEPIDEVIGTAIRVFTAPIAELRLTPRDPKR